MSLFTLKMFTLYGVAICIHVVLKFMESEDGEGVILLPPVFLPQHIQLVK